MNEEYWRRKLEQFGKTYGQNLERLKSILFENRGYVVEIPTNETVILLFSGGMDSTILIDLVIRKWNCKIILLYFKRNSKNQRWEEESISYFYKFYKERWPENILELILLEMEIPSRINKKFMNRTRQKVMMLPLRNTTMWDNAFTQAVYLSGKYDTTIRTVIIGSVKEDLSSPESGILSILSHNVHVNISMGLWYYQLLAPFIDQLLDKTYNKKDLLDYARDFDIPLEKSRSCFGASEQPCNECLACENRNKAYLEYKNK
jgi:7-cyano-7-deazaguanine synthase in queuosine biosynthesis